MRRVIWWLLLVRPAAPLVGMGIQQAASIRRSARLAGSKAGAERLAREVRRSLAATSRANAPSSSSSSSEVVKPTAAGKGSSSSVADRQRPKRGRQPRAPSGAAPTASAAAAAALPKKVATLGRAREDRKRRDGFGMVIGVDEAGRGPFAGPVVAAACFIPPDVKIAGVRDSKKVTRHVDREALYKELTEAPGVCWATSEIGSRRIDEINILEATKEAMTNCALEVCSMAPKGKKKPLVLIDGNFTPPGLAGVDAECVIGGDGLEYCIAAASIIAKVTRDRLMIEYGQQWPVFGFETHKGYGTAGHRDAIREHGTVEIHRRSFLKKMEAAGGKLAEYKG